MYVYIYIYYIVINIILLYYILFNVQGAEEHRALRAGHADLLHVRIQVHNDMNIFIFILVNMYMNIFA